MPNPIIDLAPKPFVDFLHATGRRVRGNWRKSSVYLIWKAGYNAAVAEANRKTLERYAMPERRLLVAGPAPARRSQLNGSPV